MFSISFSFDSAYTFEFTYQNLHIIRTVQMIWLVIVMAALHRVYRLKCWAVLLEVAAVVAAVVAAAIHVQTVTVVWVQVSFTILIKSFSLFSFRFFFAGFCWNTKSFNEKKGTVGGILLSFHKLNKPINSFPASFWVCVCVWWLTK